MAAVSMGPQCAPLLNGSKSVHMNENDWNAKECQRQRELEEARARAAQMVKTMKWWSECTANWREKWIKVRNERNKAREEIKQLRSSLEASMKKASTYKHEKQELEMQVAQLKQKLEQMQQFKENESEKPHNTYEETTNSENSSVNKLCQETLEINLDIDCSPEVKDEEAITAKEEHLIKQLSTENDTSDEHFLEKIKCLEGELEQAQHVIKTEQNCKIMLQKSAEKLKKENAEFHKRQEQLYASKQEAVRELLTIQELHRAEINIVNKALQEEMKIRENLEKSLYEKRNELDHVQKHQNEEFCRRERLETEKLALERRNKMLSTEVRYYQDLFDHKGFPNMWRCERCGNTRPSSGVF